MTAKLGPLRSSAIKLKPVKEGDEWFVVSTIYAPPRAGSVGSGVKYCEQHQTRAQARAEIRRLYAGWHPEAPK